LRRQGKAVATLITAIAPNGYSGSIRLLVAVDPNGRLLGVRVLEHRETPGIGDAIDERKSGWIRAFTGRSLTDPPADRWRVRKDGGDFDQFTGATVTPRAVVQAVRDVQVFYAQNRERLLAAPPD
jgi:electron transport complex protein RnfG